LTTRNYEERKKLRSKWKAVAGKSEGGVEEEIGELGEEVNKKF
jgi:hypothetical protein